MKFAVSGFAHNYNANKSFHTVMVIDSSSHDAAFTQAMKILKEMKPSVEGWTEYDVIVSDGQP